MPTSKRPVKSPRKVNPSNLKKGKTANGKVAIKAQSARKVFVLDTNVLLSDPESIFKFAANDVCLPIETLEELDKFKTDQTELGAATRRLHRTLDKLFVNGSQTRTEGVILENGGRLFVTINPLDETSPSLKRMKKHFRDMDKMDHRILACALYIQETLPPPVILVTKDVNMRLKARAMGLDSQDYQNEKQAVEETKHAGHQEIDVTEGELSKFYEFGEITLPDTNISQNSYVILVNVSDRSKQAAAKAHNNNLFQKLHIPVGVSPGKDGTFIKPRSFEQAFLMDAILDPNVPLVTVQGRAGTGKTLVTLATALSILKQDGSHYEGITITRPIVSMGKELGFLPGTMEEKMAPWLQPYFDALKFLLPAKVPEKINPSQQGEPGSRKERKQDRHRPELPQQMKPYEHLMKSGLLEIEALQHIRGRSIPNRIFILDEAQQLSKHEIKTIITRMSEGSKLILMGDPDQIDNPYVDSVSNGLVYAAAKLGDQGICSNVKLVKGERSKLAEIASKLL